MTNGPNERPTGAGAAGVALRTSDPSTSGAPLRSTKRPGGGGPGLRPSGEGAGAEVCGVDLGERVPDGVFARIDAALARHGVLVFRKQRLAPEQHLAFCERFGPVEVNAFDQYALPGHPGVLVVSNVVEDGRSIGYADAGSHWHTDMSYTATPPRCTALYALEVPSAGGRNLGDTLFANARAAWEALDENDRRDLEGLRAVHRFGAKERGVKRPVKLTAEQLARYPDVTHPLVRTHPVSGAKALYVRKGECVGVEGLPVAEALALIERLSDHVVRPEFQYRHRWRVGDLVIWDNCVVQHVALRDYEWPQRRRMHRVTAAGSVPF